MDSVHAELAALRSQLADATRKGADLAIRHANDAVELDQLRAQLEEARAEFRRINVQDPELMEKVRGFVNAEHGLVVDMEDGTGRTGLYVETGFLRGLLDSLATKDAEAQELRQSLQDALQRVEVTTRENETLHESLQRIERAYKDMGAQRDALQARVERLEGNAAARDVLAERKRQVEAEGWTPEHDDRHSNGEMAAAAACYARESRLIEPLEQKRKWNPPVIWPWAKEWWKPADRRRMLVKAGALILAEIERLDRAALADKGE